MIILLTDPLVVASGLLLESDSILLSVGSSKLAITHVESRFFHVNFNDSRFGSNSSLRLSVHQKEPNNVFICLVSHLCSCRILARLESPLN